jgi:hypothetical protein
MSSATITHSDGNDIEMNRLLTNLSDSSQSLEVNQCPICLENLYPNQDCSQTITSNYDEKNPEPKSAIDKPNNSSLDSVESELFGLGSALFRPSFNGSTLSTSRSNSQLPVNTTTDLNTSVNELSDIDPTDLITFPCPAKHRFHYLCIIRWLHISSLQRITQLENGSRLDNHDQIVQRGRDSVTCPCCRESSSSFPLTVVTRS